MSIVLIRTEIDYEVTANGQWFLFGMVIGAAPPINAILNLTAELKGARYL